MKEKYTIGIVGNPNCGKTSLFNALTGGKQRVGNWSGVTVERKEGPIAFHDMQVQAVDLPGIYSLSSSSLDEEIARDYIVSHEPDLIVNIVDASNLERNLYLTIQLIEMRVPLLVVFNMMDIAKQKKLKINIDEIARILDVPIICTVANKKEGIDEVHFAIERELRAPRSSSTHIYFPDEIEGSLEKVIPFIHEVSEEKKYNERWLAIKVLENDLPDGLTPQRFDKALNEVLEHTHHTSETILGDSPDIIIAESRYGFINSLCKKCIDRRDIVRKGITDAIDAVVLNRFLGIPLFFVAMYLMFWITINFGGSFIDFFDGVFGTLFVDGAGVLLSNVGAPPFLIMIVANGIGGGIQTVATFIPPIFFMFLCLALLEDSGYMARAAFVMDRSMRFIGLPGKAFVPMLVGFGCNVPAIMATRTLDSEKDRIMTIMLNPFMSCGARMPVYALFAAAFFPQTGSVIVFVLYIIGILLAIMTAFILKGTILKGEASSFIMELPPYHIPTIPGILLHTWERLKAFILRAGKAIVLVVLILSSLGSIGIDGSIANQQKDNSILNAIGKMSVPVFKPMGIREDNWPAVVGIFTGVFAKETVIATLDSIYAQLDEHSVARADEEAPPRIWENIKESFVTIPNNLTNLSVPFSLGGLIGADVDTAVEELEVKESTYASLTKRFDGKAGAFAYLLMILLYMPCVAAIAAVYRELNLRWTLFSAGYLSGLAWLVSVFFYQCARFSFHPLQSIGWISFTIAVFGIFIVILKQWKLPIRD